MAGDPVPCGRDVSPGWTGLPEAPGPVAAGHGANSATGWSPAWFGHGNAPGQVDAVMAGEGQEHRAECFGPATPASGRWYGNSVRLRRSRLPDGAWWTGGWGRDATRSVKRCAAVRQQCGQGTGGGCGLGLQDWHGQAKARLKLRLRFRMSLAGGPKTENSGRRRKSGQPLGDEGFSAGETCALRRCQW